MFCLRVNMSQCVYACVYFDKPANVIKMNKFDPFQRYANNFYTKLLFSQLNVMRD